jgi:UMF1 family MFS transporter
MLAALTLLGMGATLAFGLLEPGWALAGCLLGALADFGFEGGIVFYNAYLPEVAPPGKQGAVSGLGFAVGYAGSLVALGGGALLAAGGDWSLVWVALAAQWGLAAVVSLRGLPPDRPVAAGVGAAARAGIARTVGALRRLKNEPALRTFLLAAFFYLNGVHTVIWFAAVYAHATLGFSVGEVLGLVAVVQATALVGSLLAAGPTDRRGPRATVRVLALWWVGAAIAAGLAADKTAFWIVGGLAGLGLGAIQAASRALMARLVRPGREAESFALYALCGRTGAVAGPLVFGIVASLAGSQRPAVVSVAGFLLVGWGLLGILRSPALQEDADE